MAKFKVYELAKELDKSSKEVLTFLQEKGVEVKAAQSSVDDAAAEMVRKHFGVSTQTVKAAEDVKTEAPKAEAPKTEAPKAEETKAEVPKKKKSIVFVSNPQYSKMPDRTTESFPSPLAGKPGICNIAPMSTTMNTASRSMLSTPP